jgi:hypothetical protein
MKTLTILENARRAATAKVTLWCDVQMRAAVKKSEARAAGNDKAAAVYFRAEVAASNRRAKHEDALCKLARM